MLTRAKSLTTFAATAVAAGALALTPAAAHAAVRSVQALGDPGTTYTIHGRRLTISSHDPVVLQFVRGHGLFVFCDPSGRNPRAGSGGASWGRHASRVTVTFKRDFSGRIASCTASRGAGGPYLYNDAFSYAAFTAAARRRLGHVPAPAVLFAHLQLADALQAIEVTLPTSSRSGAPPKTLPAARALVSELDARPPFKAERLVYTRTVSGVRRRNVTYVVGRGSSRTRLELAAKAADGRRYVLRARAGRLSGRFGPA